MIATEYTQDNLKNDDRKVLAVLDSIREEVFRKDSIDEYLREHEYIGKEQGKLLKEYILPYLSFLKESFERKSFDWMMDTIDSYTEDDIRDIKGSHE